MAYASPTNVAELLARELTEEESVVVNRRLTQIERLILRRIPDLDDRVEADPVYLADVIDVESEAVARVLRNPDGYRSESDGSYGYQLDPEIASGVLEILPHEWEILGIAQRSSGLLVPTFAPITPPTPPGVHPFLLA